MEVTQEFVKSILNYIPETGEMFWVKPNKYHPDLVGKIAGCQAKSGGDKIYWNIQVLGKNTKDHALHGYG